MCGRRGVVAVHCVWFGEKRVVYEGGSLGLAVLKVSRIVARCDDELLRFICFVVCMIPLEVYAVMKVNSLYGYNAIASRGKFVVDICMCCSCSR